MLVQASQSIKNARHCHDKKKVVPTVGAGCGSDPTFRPEIESQTYELSGVNPESRTIDTES